MVNTDFYATDSDISASAHLDQLFATWEKAKSKYDPARLDELIAHTPPKPTLFSSSPAIVDGFYKTLILSERNFLNYSRNLLAFGIRSMHLLFPVNAIADAFNDIIHLVGMYGICESQSRR
jgi:hypothetical protein